MPSSRGIVAVLSSAATLGFLIVVFSLSAVAGSDGRPRPLGKSQRLIVVLVDGVRSDYVQRDTELKGFRRIADNGVRAEYVTPIFPSNSYPNWYTIVTGLYAENHGFVQNYMYDTHRQEFFEMAPTDNASNEHWWNKTEPIWVTAERSGHNTAMHWWDGCQVSIRGVKPSVCQEYVSYWVWGDVIHDTLERLNQVLDWFHESPNNSLAMVYYEGVDAQGHFRGPDSDETIQAMKDIDTILDQFQNKLDNSSLKEEVNLVVLSDHGMANSGKNDVEIIHLDNYPNITDDIEIMLDRGSVAMILPVEGREEKLYSHLKRLNIKGLRVYRRQEIPEKYHLKENDLVLPILLVADEGVFIQKISNVRKMKPHYSKIFRGFHGYDPYKNTTKMRTILYARGPAFRKGAVSPPIQMTDHYNVFCHILGVEPHDNNGSWHRVERLLASSDPTALAASLENACVSCVPHIALVILVVVLSVLS